VPVNRSTRVSPLEQVLKVLMLLMLFALFCVHAEVAAVSDLNDVNDFGLLLLRLGVWHDSWLGFFQGWAAE
jgi:hypothetical protein